MVLKNRLNRLELIMGDNALAVHYITRVYKHTVLEAWEKFAYGGTPHHKNPRKLVNYFSGIK